MLFKLHELANSKLPLYCIWHVRPEHKFWHWFLLCVASTLSLVSIFQYSPAPDIGEQTLTRVVHAEAPGLVAGYAFDEGTGTTAADVSGNGNTGTLANGPAWTTGQYSNALSFDGVDDRVDVISAPTLDTTTAFTVELWYNATQNAKSIIAKPVGTGTRNSWQFEFTNSTTLSFTSSDGSVQNFDTTTAPAAGAWHYVAGTWDGTTKKLYLDGVEKISIARSIAWDTKDVVIGGDYNSGSFVLPFSGLVDDVRIYNRALSQSEIQTDMNTPVGSSPPPSDTTPPNRSNGAPAGQLSSGTTQTTLSLTTDENATCKYSTTAGASYSSIPSTFSTTGSTNHSTLITGLANGQSYTYYIRCQDTASIPNANPDDYPISFSVATPAGDTTLPIVSLSEPIADRTLSGTVTVRASATDLESGITSVSFTLNPGNVPLGTSLNSPYQVSWDTTTASNSSYTLTATATNGASLTTTSAPVNVTVSNGAAGGKVYYVDNSCVTSGDGTTTTCGAHGPYKTIDEAFNACTGSDGGNVIEIRTGTGVYRQRAAHAGKCVGSSGNPFIVQNYVNEAVLVEGTTDAKSGHTWTSRGSGVFECTSGTYCSAPNGQVYWHIWYTINNGAEQHLVLDKQSLATCDSGSETPGHMGIVASTGNLCVNIDGGSSPSDASITSFMIPAILDFAEPFTGPGKYVTWRKNPSGGSFTIRRFRNTIFTVTPLDVGYIFDGLSVGWVYDRCFDTSAPGGTQGSAGIQYLNNTVSYCGQEGIRIDSDTGSPVVQGNDVSHISD